MAAGAEEKINDIMNMGFGRPEVEAALQAAYYDKERAVDYLLNGIPENPIQEQPVGQVPAGQPPAAGDQPEGDNPLAFLANNPMFDQLRERIIQEPQFFQTFMSQLQQTQPQLYAQISANPQAFLQLLLGGEGGAAG